MHNQQPKGIKIQHIDSETKKIVLPNRTVSFHDYLILFIIVYAAILLLVFVVTEKQNGLEYIVLLLMTLILVLIAFSLYKKVKEVVTVIISNSDVEIETTHLWKSDLTKIPKEDIEKIEFQTQGLFSIFNVGRNPILEFRILISLGSYKLPRIKHKNLNTYFAEYYDQKTRLWIVKYLQNELRNTTPNNGEHS